MPLPIQSYNLSTGNKWILTIPFKQIDQTMSVDNIAMNLTSMTLPELTIGQTDFPIMGRSIPIPTHIQNEDKNLSFRYMLSSDWHQYKILYKWFSMLADENSSSTAPTSDLLLDLTVFVLSEYKHTLFSIVFKGCWINRIGSVEFNYQQGEENISHEFGVNYALYEFVDLL